MHSTVKSIQSLFGNSTEIVDIKSVHPNFNASKISKLSFENRDGLYQLIQEKYLINSFIQQKNKLQNPVAWVKCNQNITVQAFVWEWG